MTNILANINEKICERHVFQRFLCPTPSNYVTLKVYYCVTVTQF